MNRIVLVSLTATAVAVIAAAAGAVPRADQSDKSNVAKAEARLYDFDAIQKRAKKVEVTARAKFGGPVTQTVIASCQTEKSDWDGRQDTCRAPWQVLEAPAGSVIVEHQLGVNKSGNGTYECSSGFSEPVEIIPGSGIKMATKFHYSAWAWSHEGSFGGAGHVNCTYTVLFAVYQK